MTRRRDPSVLVVGATPGGIAAAVRAARDGAETVLAATGNRLGGMMASGLSYTDTVVTKPRASILQEFVERVRTHYREEYGVDSEQFRDCEDGYVFEPHVASEIFEQFVEAEPKLTVVRGFRPTEVRRQGRILKAVVLEPSSGSPIEITADVYVEATYEGDLLDVSGVEYTLGREGRDEFDEQFAGRLFTDTTGDRYFPSEAVAGESTVPPEGNARPLRVADETRSGDLDIVPHPAGLTEVLAGSTGEGDDAIQAYNYRFCLCSDPENRRLPEKPPNYDRSEFVEYIDAVGDPSIRPIPGLRFLPNDKGDMNTADLPGINHEYPEADEAQREEIASRHRNHALGLLYFLHHDKAVPDEIQHRAREWGLAADEFVDNDNLPWQLYVREGRRLQGRYVFDENDARLAPGLDRTPIHADAVSIAEYPLDSHACHDETTAGSKPEGGFFASQVTRPSQIPYRALLPRGVDNLLVPVPLSATHIGFGTVRLEPTWLQIGEASGVAGALAARTDRAPAALATTQLQRALLDCDLMLTFFNDLHPETDASWVDAVQFLGTKGFFASYDARPNEPLARSTADLWAEFAAELIEDRSETTASDRARAVRAATIVDHDGITTREFLELLSCSLGEKAPADGTWPESDSLSRGTACEMIYQALTAHLSE